MKKATFFGEKIKMMRDTVNKWMAKLDSYKEPLLYVGFILYVAAFFAEDMAFHAAAVAKVVRYISYLCFAVSGFANRRVIISGLANRPFKIVCLSLVLLLDLSMVIFKRNIYWIIITMILIVVANADAGKIVHISYKLVLALTAVTFALLVLGILPNVETVRGGDTGIRLGMGFYHSNVLPMVLFYLMVYRMLLLDKEGRMSWKELASWLAAAAFIYVICGSRNGLYGVVLCAVVYVAAQYIRLDSVAHKILLHTSKWSALLFSVFSIVMMLLQGTKSPFIHQLNRLFTGRFGNAFQQMKETGLDIINFSSAEKYAVLDNGYLYTVLRYGLLFVLFYVIVQIKLTARYKNNVVVLATSFCVMAVSMIDNEFYSYGYLPFLALAVSSSTLPQSAVLNTPLCFKEQVVKAKEFVTQYPKKTVNRLIAYFR